MFRTGAAHLLISSALRRIICAACLFSIPSSFAAEPDRRTFAIAAGEALETLKVFAAQADREIMFPADRLAGVRTKPVAGRFIPSDALARLIAGTDLVAHEDARTGAFMVRRVPQEKAPPPSAQSPPGRSPSAKPSRKYMRLGNPIAVVASWLALALAPAHAADSSVTNTTDAAQASGTISGRVKNVVTGQYLNNARVSVRGTDRVDFTDQSGTYRLASVPAGSVVLEVFYTDLDAQTVPLEISAGQTIEHDVGLTSVARYGRDPAVVTLDPYLVSSDKETDAQAIANNEQRFAPNIKNVMSTDSLGDVLGSSVGEFLKFMPGVTAEYDNASIVGISVRGIGGAMTSFSADGAPIVSSGFGANRSVDTNSMALNDISRIEITKVPTPSSPADSLAGSVNLVSKSAFERSHAQLRFGLSVVGNGESLTLSKTPTPYDDSNKRKITPGFDFDYSMPIGKNFGIVITALRSDRFNEQHISQMTYNTGGTATGASINRPYLQTHLGADDPRNEVRTTMSVKADWRVGRHSVLSISSQWNELVHSIGNNRLTTDVGTNGNPSPTTGVRFSFGDDFTQGAAGRGAATMSATSQRYEQTSAVTKASYRFDDGRWKVDAALSNSASKIVRRSTEHGHFQTVNAGLIMPVRVSFSDLAADYPGTVEVFDAGNQPVDLTTISNYRVLNATDAPVRKKSRFQSANANVRRRLEILPVPAAIQFGGSIGLQSMDQEASSMTWTYNGPDGNPNTADSPEPYLMRNFKNQDAGFGVGSEMPWFSARHAWSAFRENPILFSQTAAQLVSTESSRISNSWIIEETVSAAYLQAEANLFKNRLKVLTGVRYEKTQDEGQGQLFDPNAVFVRNADGSFARDSSGARIRKLEAGLAGSMEELRLIRRERAYRGEKTYDGYYPSLHLTYDIRENFLARVAYAETYGRPNFSDIIPTANINETDLDEDELNDPTVIRGTITVNNTGLRPWTANNYDLSLEYYTQQGGLFSAGVFLKEIKDFFGTSVKIATAEDLATVGLDPRYVGWNLNTKFNSGDARITGAEFNLRHSLRPLGRWGSYFTVFANATKLKLEGHQQASFTSFVPKTANWGASFSRKRITLIARWNYRGLNKLTAVPAFGPDAFGYIKARTTLDLSLAYQLSRRLSLVGSVNNVFDEPQVALRYGSATPEYARQFNTRNFGVMFSFGIKGTF